METLDDPPGAAPSARGRSAGSRRTQFKPGHPGRPLLEPESDAPAPASPLADMRWVYAHKKGEDRTPGQQACRTFLEKDFKGFVTLLMKLEAEEREAAQSAEEAAAPEEPIEDQGSARARALAVRFLEGLAAEVAGGRNQE